MVWSSHGPYLAIGTENGNLILYDKTVNRKKVIRGVTTKKITCGCFNEKNDIAIGSDDKRIVVLGIDGKITHSYMNDDPIAFVEFGDVVGAEQKAGQHRGRSLLALNSKGGISIFNELQNECRIELTRTFGTLLCARYENIFFFYFIFI